MFQYTRGGDMAPTRLHLPLLEHEPSETPVFTAANLLRAARIRKGLVLNKRVVCLAHITNTMATWEEDFEKGGDAGLADSLSVCAAALDAALDHAPVDFAVGKGN
jgi:hypothetical protein